MVKDKIRKAFESLDIAKKHYEEGNKRISTGELFSAKEYIEEAVYLILAEIELQDEENNNKSKKNNDEIIDQI